MAFSGVVQSAPEVSLENRDVAEERDALLAEIAQGRTDLSLLNDEKALVNKVIERKAELENEASTLTEELKAIKVELGDLGGKKIQLQADFDQLASVLSNKRVELNDQLVELQNRFDSLLKQEAEKSAELDFTIRQIAIEEERLADIQKQSNELSIKFQKEVSEAQQGIAAVLKTKKDLEERVLSLRGEQEMLAQKNSDLHAENESIQIKIGTSKVLLASAQIEVDQIIADAQMKASEIIAQAETREAAVASRESQASIKEQWIKNKEESLRNIRKELGEYYNRPINNVII